MAPGRSRRSRGTWLAGVTLLTSSILIIALAHHGFSGDVLMDIANGRFILAHGYVPLRNVMTQAMYGHPWSNSEWLFGVIVAEIYDHFGPQGLVWGPAPVLVATSFLIALLVQRAGQLWGLVLAVVTAFSLTMAMAPRPQLFSYLFFAFGIWAVLRHRKGVEWPLVAFVVAVVPLWANLHASVFLAPVLLAAEAFFGRRRDLIWLTLASLALSFAHPGGVATSGSFLASIFSPGVVNRIQEWGSLNLLQAGSWLMAPIVLVALLYTVRRASRRGDETGSMWTLAWLVATAISARFAPYLSLTVLAVTAPLVPLRLRRIERTAGRMGTAALLAVPLVFGSFSVAAAMSVTMQVTQPVGAFAYLREHHATDVLPFYSLGNDMDLYGPRPFLDSRAELWTHAPWWRDYVKANLGFVSPVAFVARWDPSARYVVWPLHYMGSRSLLRSPRWHLVFVDRAPDGTIGGFRRVGEGA